MNPHHAVVDLTPVAVVLSANPHRLRATFGCAGLVHVTDGLGMGMVFGDNLLAPISEFLSIPLDRFKEAL